MYTTGDILKKINVSRPTLYKLCKNKGVKPHRTAGGNYRFTEVQVKKLLNQKLDPRDIDEKFVNAVNDVWVIFKKLAEDIWGLEGEEKLIEILENNKQDIFLLNLSNFK